MTSVHKVLGTIERELRTLASDVYELASRFQAANPDFGMVIRRSPDRVVLQAGDVGVSVSWFRARAGERAGAELVVSEWDGEITFPGATPREGRHATQVGEQRFHLVPITDESESWVWGAVDDLAAPCSSRMLATHCVQVLTKRLVNDAPMLLFDAHVSPDAHAAVAPPVS